jgi:hypothetical protein
MEGEGSEGGREEGREGGSAHTKGGEERLIHSPRVRIDLTTKESSTATTTTHILKHNTV